MPLEISSTAIAEKNKVATGSCWLICAKITIPGVSDPVRVVRNTENLTWRGETWTAFPFEVDELTDSAKNEIPSIAIRVGNVNRVIEAYLEEYDVYVKANGPQRIKVTVYVVNTNDLASGTPATEYTFHLKQPKANAKWATFTLGAINTFQRRVPQGRTLRNVCRFKFKGTRCGYSGSVASCDKTLTTCRTLGNAGRFGGFPGAGFGGLNVA